MICGLYSGILGIMMPFFGASFMCENMLGQKVGKERKLHKIFRSFGKRWWEKLIPIQTSTTFLAWPGVSWDEDLCLI
jgi:hypothetical protein